MFCVEFGATASLCLGNHHQSNGQTERTKQILENTLPCVAAWSTEYGRALSMPITLWFYQLRGFHHLWLRWVINPPNLTTRRRRQQSPLCGHTFAAAETYGERCSLLSSALLFKHVDMPISARFPLWSNGLDTRCDWLRRAFSSRSDWGSSFPTTWEHMKWIGWLTPSMEWIKIQVKLVQKSEISLPTELPHPYVSLVGLQRTQFGA